MIRIKLLSEPEYKQALRRIEHREPEYEKVLQGKEYCEYWKGEFYSRWGNFYHLLEEKGEFTDEASCAFLRYLHGEVAVREKLYSCVTPEGKARMPAISEEAQYGLVVIENSRRGFYTSFEPQVTEGNVHSLLQHVWEGPHPCPSVWEALASLDMDILLVFRQKDLSPCFGYIPIDAPFILENYPMDGCLREVYVSKKIRGETPDTYHGLPWISNNFDDMEYQWQENIDELITVIDSALEYRIPDRTGAMTHWFSEQEIVDEINCTTENRWTPILVIEEYRDGSYRLRTEALKYPYFDELWWLADISGKEDADVLLLPLDVEDPMSCAKDIKNATCVFRVSEKEILVSDREKGLYEFQKVLKKIKEGDFRVEKSEENCRLQVRLLPR